MYLKLTLSVPVVLSHVLYGFLVMVVGDVSRELFITENDQSDYI